MSESIAFVLPTKEFHDALKIVAAATAGRGQSLVYQQVKLTVQPFCWVLTASDQTAVLHYAGDNSNGSPYSLEGQTQSMLIDTKVMLGILSRASGETMHCDFKQSILHVRIGRGQFKVRVNCARSFILPEDRRFKPARYTVPSSDLKDAISRTIFASGYTKPVFAGIQFRYASGYLCVEATDGHRLARAACAAECSDSQHKVAVMPDDYARLAERFLGGHPAVVLIFDHSIVIGCGPWQISCPALEGNLPNLDSAIEASSEGCRTVEVDAGDLLKAARCASLVTTEESLGVTLTFDRHQIRANSAGQDIGDCSVVIPIPEDEQSECPVSVTVPANHLTDFLQTLPKETTVSCQFTNDESPLILRTAKSVYLAAAMTTI